MGNSQINAKTPRTIMPNEPTGPAPPTAPAVLEEVAAVAVPVTLVIEVPVPDGPLVVDMLAVMVVVVEVNVVLVPPAEVDEEDMEHASPALMAKQKASEAGCTVSIHYIIGYLISQTIDYDEGGFAIFTALSRKGKETKHV